MENETPSEALGEATIVEVEPAETPSQTEAVPEVQETSPAEPEEEKLYAGKYKTVEELEKGYHEVQKAYTQKSQKVSSSKNIASELYGGTAPAPAATVPLVEVQTEEEAQTYLNNLVAQQVKDQTQGIMSKVEPMMAELEIERVRSKYPELPELLPQIKQVYDDYPEMRKPGNLERALRLAKADYMPEVVKEARKEGEQIANSKFEAARAASTETVKSTSEGKTGPTDEEVANMSSTELLKYLKH